MDGFSWNLLVAATGIAVTHTLLGPDHYLPFVMLARACRWTRTRALVVTLACGVGHVLSSVLLGTIGLALGSAVFRLEEIEAARGSWAAWGLVAVGIAYAVWGARRAFRRRHGLEPHAHGDHVHLHRHGRGGHEHDHEPARRDAVAFWTLFAVFVLGPCEPLIPLFVLPASRGRLDLAALTALVFGIATIATMLAATLAGLLGLERLPLGPLERWSHAVAGVVIALSGASILALGL